jgi:GH24 family phage-related lysozyme (muramidase)
MNNTAYIQGYMHKEAASALPMLLKAKYLSDKRDYKGKANVMRALLQEEADNFVIDSVDKGIIGLTHKPTGFRMHLPEKEMHEALQGVQKEAAERPAPVLDDNDPSYDNVIPMPIRKAEGWVPRFKPDPRGINTGGYGINAKANARILQDYLGKDYANIVGGKQDLTRKQSAELFNLVSAPMKAHVSKMTGRAYTGTPAQEALLSYIYNFGINGAPKVTKHVTDKDYAGAFTEMLLGYKYNPKYPGLAERRKNEAFTALGEWEKVDPSLASLRQMAQRLPPAKSQVELNAQHALLTKAYQRRDKSVAIPAPMPVREGAPVPMPVKKGTPIAMPVVPKAPPMDQRGAYQSPVPFDKEKAMQSLRNLGTK